MQRVEISASIGYTTTGYPANNAKVRITRISDGGLATIYKAAVGSEEWPNPLTTDHGRLNGWLDRGSYKLEITGDQIVPRTEYYEAVPADEAVYGDDPRLDALTDASYTHNQLISSTEWVITHGLGKKPSVTIVDSGDNVIVGEVHYDSLNQVTITLAGATSGKAYLN